ncbi:MAG: DUF2066 domain-containing protein [Gammaproteobacteria bacterium]|nr:DUF2066 domain-containing protein [Gammaproteobacteria bacterium]
MLKFTAKILVFVSVLLVSYQAAAGLVASLYDVEILVTDESAEVRNQAFEQGLDEVFVRISGDSIVMDKLKRPPASRYVKQFSYEPLSASAADAVTGTTASELGEVLTHRLKIQYNGSLMEKYLMDNGFPVWGEYRPDVIVWLVVRDGRNQYVLKDADQSLLKTAASDALARRGVPARWPIYDNSDRSVLTVADIRGGFGGPVINASKRYATDTALAGSMIWNGAQWQSSWSLFVKGESRHWNLDDTDYGQLINKAIDQAADMLGAFFAVRNAASNQQLVSIQVDIQAVNSIIEYRYVENFLSGLSAVAHVEPLKVDGQSAVFSVLLRSNEEDFHYLMKNNAALVEVRAPQTVTTQSNTTQDNTHQSNADQAATAQTISLIMPESQAGNSGEKNGAGEAETELAQTEKTQVEKNQAEKIGAAIPPKQVPIYYYRLNQR